MSYNLSTTEGYIGTKVSKSGVLEVLVDDDGDKALLRVV